MTTWFARKEDVNEGTIARDWFVVDASQHTLGRLATRIAMVLRGRHKATYTPHVDVGDFVVVINAEKIKVTGRKLDQKTYHHYSGSPGGLKARVLKDVLAKHPERVIEAAVEGMLPDNRLARKQFLKLKVYAGPQHPHEAQNPQPLV